MKTKLGRPAKWKNRTKAYRLPEFMDELFMQLGKIGDEEGYEINGDRSISYKKGGTLERVMQVIENTGGYFVQKSPKKRAKQDEKARDSRLDHPAIIAVRELIRCWPKEETRDEIIATLGLEFDKVHLASCYVEWCKVSQNKFNLRAWLFDWYVNGIPNGKGRHAPSDAQLLAGHDELVRALQNGQRK